jgi:hypothetical protein
MRIVLHGILRLFYKISRMASATFFKNGCQCKKGGFFIITAKTVYETLDGETLELAGDVAFYAVPDIV